MHQPSVLIADQLTRSSKRSTTESLSEKMSDPSKDQILFRIGAEKHCIFRSAGQHFSLPAAAVRELTIARGIVPVPASHRSLAGLYVARGRFLPVISLQDLLQLAPPDPPQLHQQLIVIDGASPWTLRVTEAVAVDALHSGITCDEPPLDSLRMITKGMAGYGSELVYMLDPLRLLRFAQHVMDDSWYPPRPLQESNQPHGDEQ